MYCYFRYLSAQCLLGYFDKLGVLDTGKTLEYLGIVGQEDMLELNIVVAAINDHISNLVCYDKYSVYAAITALLCDEIIITQHSAGNLSLERDRLTEEMQVCDVNECQYLLIPLLADNGRAHVEKLLINK